MEVMAVAFFVALAIWFFGIWRSSEERHRHPPRY
jgi:hypothetical protein